MASKINLPKEAPISIKVAVPARVRGAIKSKFVPRDPKDGEVMLLVQRPQVGAYEFLEYAKGDFLQGQELLSYVVLLSKPGYTRGGEGYKVWEQLVVARLATDADRAALAEQFAARETETQRVMDRMMQS